MLREHPEFVCVGEASSGPAAVIAIRTARPDIVFLDIDMPGQDGFRTLAGLEPSIRPAVVFVTAHRQFALDAFGVDAIDYLLKPVGRQRLAQTARRAVQFLQRAPASGRAAGTVRPGSSGGGSAERLPLRDGDRLLFISPSDVRWFEVEGNYLRAAVGQNILQVRSSLNAIIPQLGAGAFARISRSVLVNVAHVESVRPRHNGQFDLTMCGGGRLCSSRRYRAEVRKLLKRT